MKKFKNPWYKRLAMDQNLLKEFVSNSDVVSVKPLNGSFDIPPTEYELIYSVRSIVGINDDSSPIYGDKHTVNISIPEGYPMLAPPSCYVTSPIWHPNIKSSGKFKGHVCINAQVLGFWHTLDMLVERIGVMLQYKNYHAENVQPYPEDTIVAKWVRNYAEPKGIVDRSKGICTDNNLLIKPSKEWLTSRNNTNKVKIGSIKFKSGDTKVFNNSTQTATIIERIKIKL